VTRQQSPVLLHELLVESAGVRPGAIAVVDGDRQLTYGELDDRSGQLASLLVGRAGVQRGDRVAVYLDKSIEAVVAIYAVLKTGAAYVPLDVSSPAPRLAAVASNCAARAVITSARRRDHLAELVTAGVRTAAFVVVDGHGGPPTVGGVEVITFDSTALDPAGPITSGVTSLDLAYVLYTSGSTGQPKGVMLSHRNALSFVDWATAEFGITASDRLSSHAPFHFDLSVFDLFAAAAAAATVVLVPPSASVLPAELRRFIDAHGITVWYSVPSVLGALARRGGLDRAPLAALRTVLFAGEVFPTAALRRLMELLPGVRFANLYGPTETNVCTWFEVMEPPADGAPPVPIGHAIRDDEVFAVTDDGRRAEVGEIGELYVRGATVMAGYWADPERTARSLVAPPIGATTGGLAYRTGDLVVQRPDGAFEYVGRRDAQIKSRGYRIELGDIEAALHASDEVLEAVVVAVPDDDITNRLVAYVVLSSGADAAAVRSACAARLPPYMVPERVEVVGSLPRTSTGKIDRQELASTASRST
jgi:amino acid adenylation domain-containing protein